jgi:uncharacterized protein (TIGR02145 family)
MAENLNVEKVDSWCYGNDNSNCAKYGRLYDWYAAKKACPSEWHLPSNEEWNTLIEYVGGHDFAGKRLKSKSDWKDNGNGTDSYGFSALPGGNRTGEFEGGSFKMDDKHIGDMGYWWTDYVEDIYAHARILTSANSIGNEEFGLLGHRVYYGYSVRCVKD